MEKRKITQLKNWDKNPRSIKKNDFERLKTQIRDLGQYKPLLITEDGTVLGGNMRLRAYRELGVEEVWVSIVDAKTEDEKLAYALSDNDRAGYYDADLLANLIPDFPNFEWEQYAVDLKEPQNLQQLIDSLTPEEEDEAPAISEDEPISKIGEIYTLGRHRLMCGDATNINDVSKLMDGAKADMVFTDPPYNVDYEGSTGLKIENDKMDKTAFYQFLNEAFVNLLTSLKRGGAIYICHADLEGLNFRKAFEDAGFSLKTTIIWNKNSLVMGRGDYHWKHEPILYGWQEGQTHNWFGDRSQTSVWDISKPSINKEHPTMKPIALIARAIKNSSKAEDIVLDTFAGSGSTLIACEQLDRTAYIMELDPKYCDVIRKRYENYINRQTNGKK